MLQRLRTALYHKRYLFTLYASQNKRGFYPRHSRLVSFLRGTDLVFRRVRKIAKSATIGFMFVRLSVRMEQLGSHRMDFHEI